MGDGFVRNTVLRWAAIRLPPLPVSVPSVFRRRDLAPTVLTAALIVAGFTALVSGSRSYVTTGPAAEEPYNLVVEGFRAGHCWLAKEAPPELAKAANPYLFATYRPFLGPPWSVVDLSYYRGHLYAYFGVTPAVLLFWPYRLLTGGFLHQAHAVLFFSILGYALSVGLGVAVWRRYFPEVGRSAGVVLSLLLGSVTTLPVFLVRPGLYEVSISCAFALVMLSLAALWKAWHRDAGRAPWLAAASLAYGLAVGARPSLLYGAAVVFLPSAASLWARVREGRKTSWARDYLAALVPIAGVGAGLAAFNLARFGSALQFGHDYQLSGNDVYGTRSFAARFLWDNVRLYFLEPLRWHAQFPFVWAPVCPPLAPGHLPVEFFFGTATNLPILLAAALAPLACAFAARQCGSGLSWFAATLGASFLVVAVTICAYAGATSRYLLDFMPALALLAWIGVVGLHSGAATKRFTGYRVVPLLRAVAVAAFAYSVAVGWLLALALSAFYRGAEEGVSLLNSGRIQEGIALYEKVCRIDPDFQGTAELGIGSALLSSGRAKEAVGYLQSAVLDGPKTEAASFYLGRAYMETGNFREAAKALDRASSLDPLDAEAEAYLGISLARMGRLEAAVAHLKAALRIDSSMDQVRGNLRALEIMLEQRRNP